MKPIITRRRGLLAGSAVAGVVVVVMIMIVGGGSKKAGRPFPEPGDVEEVTDKDELGVSFLRDFVIGADDAMYLAVGKDDDSRLVLSISAKGKRSTVLRSGKAGGGVEAARALALGRDDVLYVADAEGKGIVTRTRQGKLSRIGPYSPTDEADDTSPGIDDVEHMVVDPATGDVYLADQHKIDRLTPGGELTTIAGARRPFDARLEAAPEAFTVEKGPESGPAKQYRFNYVEGIAFVPDTGELYAIDFGRLMKIDRQGTLTVLSYPDVVLSDALMYDAGRKNFYVGARSLHPDSSGIARIDLKGDTLMLSGSDPASSITDRLAVDSKGNAYWLSKTVDSVRVIGDLLSETRVDLKKRRT